MKETPDFESEEKNYLLDKYDTEMMVAALLHDPVDFLKGVRADALEAFYRDRNLQVKDLRYDPVDNAVLVLEDSIWQINRQGLESKNDLLKRCIEAGDELSDGNEALFDFLKAASFTKEEIASWLTCGESSSEASEQSTVKSKLEILDRVYGK